MIKKIFTLITATIISFVAFLPSDAAWASPEKKNEPEIKAESAIIYIGDTGEIIWDKNSDTKMEPASITKLMTCNTYKDISASRRKDNRRTADVCGSS